MSVASRLFQLQATDIELKDKRRLLLDIVARLERDEALSALESGLKDIESRLAASRATQRQLEYDVDDLTAKVRDLTKRLYGGTVHNPKELMSLQQDIDSVKKRQSEKEEALLEAMAASEEQEALAASARSRVAEARRTWENGKEGLRAERAAVEAAVSRLVEARQALRQELGDAVTRVYDHLAQSKGVAVVRVEQGRCRGCNLTVPTGLWQRARAGEMVECGSCGRILHVD